jgi:hypothetical protein
MWYPMHLKEILLWSYKILYELNLQPNRICFSSHHKIKELNFIHYLSILIIVLAKHGFFGILFKMLLLTFLFLLGQLKLIL